jgi:hypothetical protein
MNVFDTHSAIIRDYASYIRSFLRITDLQMAGVVDRAVNGGLLWPEPLLQFNPSFRKSGTVAELVGRGVLHPGTDRIFREMSLYQHQETAIRLGTAGQDFVVTSGTGSGKSLTYIGTVFHHLLQQPDQPGVVAIIVYPMNALINSQTEELERYKANYEQDGRPFPITFGQYTGQEKDHVREKLIEQPPHILLTNYMMLELLLARVKERRIRDGIYGNLRFLVFDELHTYRGRQGSDVAMLIRRIRGLCRKPVTCIGTSATMVSGGSLAEQQTRVAEVATRLFGKRFQPDQVVSEVLDRSLATSPQLPTRSELAAAISSVINPDLDLAALKNHPVAVWLENAIALNENDGRLVRGTPLPMTQIAAKLAEASGCDQERCAAHLQQLLLWLSSVNRQLQNAGQRYTILPFKLHQFISQTGSVYVTLDADPNARDISLEPGYYRRDAAGLKPKFQVVFSRASGQPFLSLTRNRTQLEPRDFNQNTAVDDHAPSAQTDGYLILNQDAWNPVDDLDQLPDSWFTVTKKSGRQPTTERRPSFPIRLWFDAFGNCSEAGPVDSPDAWGWFMKAPLLFDPTAGLFFDRRTSEGTKLTRLGSEGRSTSTTILTFNILNRLADAGYSTEDQKLLSFTDNRQDAALQAGHFNDFVQVIRLRSAIHSALQQSPDHTLTAVGLGAALRKSLNLPFLEYANRNEEPAFAHHRRQIDDTFEKFLTLRAIADLRRGWRIILPNLEQCALLEIDYAHLDEVAADGDFWAGLPIVASLTASQRREFLTTILDFFRMEFALASETHLQPASFKRLFDDARNQLRPPWTFDAEEHLREPTVVRCEPKRHSTKLSAMTTAGRTRSSGPTTGARPSSGRRNTPISVGTHRWNRTSAGFIVEAAPQSFRTSAPKSNACEISTSSSTGTLRFRMCFKLRMANGEQRMEQKRLPTIRHSPLTIRPFPPASTSYSAIRRGNE